MVFPPHTFFDFSYLLCFFFLETILAEKRRTGKFFLFFHFIDI